MNLDSDELLVLLQSISEGIDETSSVLEAFKPLVEKVFNLFALFLPEVNTFLTEFDNGKTNRIINFYTRLKNSEMDDYDAIAITEVFAKKLPSSEEMIKEIFKQALPSLIDGLSPKKNTPTPISNFGNLFQDSSGSLSIFGKKKN